MSIYTALRRILAPGDPVVTMPRESGSSRTEFDLRRDAESILKEAITAAEPEQLTYDALRVRADRIPEEGRVWLVGFGNSAAAMARGARQALGYRINGGVVVVPPGQDSEVPAGFDAFCGGHPIPDQASVAASSAIRQVVEEAGKQDVVICLISGGGSSLLTLPPEGMPLEDVQQVTRLLIDAGASIEEMNCVRKHLDQLKGGRLAQLAAPARVLALAMSEVVGDPLDVIASGPVAPDATRFADAVEVLRRHGLWKQMPLAARGYLDRGVCREIGDSPSRVEPFFERIESVIIGNAHTAARAACAEAERLGYESQVLTTTLTGQADQAGLFLAETVKALIDSNPVRRRTCIVTAGETRIAANGEAHGGPNQELALSAAIQLDGLEGVLLTSMATAGRDGATDAAGAVVTGTTAGRAKRAGLDVRAALATHTVYPVLEKLDDLIVSGPTGTNVADIQVLLVH